MILSQVFNKKSLAANVRPSFWGAWLFVLCDVVLILALVLLLLPIIGTFVYAYQPSEASTGFFLVVVYIIVPIGVLVNACHWAYRARKRY